MTKQHTLMAMALALAATNCGDEQSKTDAGPTEDRTSVELLAVAGNTPTVRLEQDDSAGFDPQIWDVGGNELGFFVRDRSNAATLPLRVQPAAPTNAVFVAADGKVGLGTSEPKSSLHVQGDGTVRIAGSGGQSQLSIVESSTTAAVRTLLRLRNMGGVQLSLENEDTAATWHLRNVATSGAFYISLGGTGANELQIDPSGNVIIAGDLTVTGTCTGCDAVFTPAYRVESIEAHAEYMWKHHHLRGVGPTPEDAPLKLSQKTTGILNELEKAHIYIAELNEALKSKDAKIAALEGRLDRLEKLVDERRPSRAMIPQ